MTLPLWCLDALGGGGGNDQDEGSLHSRLSRVRLATTESLTATFAARLCAGDHDAFTALAELHYERVVKVAWSVVASKEIAQDIAQDVFVQLWARRESLDERKLTSAYILASAYNRALDEMKAQRVRTKHRDAAVANAVHDVTAAATPSPEEGILSRAEFEGALETLPERWRHAIRLRFQEGLAVDELAATLGLTPNATHQLLYRAIRQLRDRLGYAKKTGA
jgi:RNA polymerase sigma-70 factor (ECF subfamily)